MTPATEADRAFARHLAAESIANGDSTGWFETLYAAAQLGAAIVPWVNSAPNPRLVSALAGYAGRGRALVVGCGLGDDAEHLASLGFTTVAFDVSPSAIATARRRFPASTVEYVTADLLTPPQSWAGAFDLVVEIYTLQVLTGPARHAGFGQIAHLVAPGGRLLVIAKARDDHDHPGTMPWPLTRTEIESFRQYGLNEESIVQFNDGGSQEPVRRWQAWFTAPPDHHPERLLESTPSHG
jgi:SAM-dependent methyltransferase